MIDLSYIIENGKVGESYKLHGLPEEFITVEVIEGGLKITGSELESLCDGYTLSMMDEPFISPEQEYLTFSEAIRAVLFEGKTVRGSSWWKCFTLAPVGDSFALMCEGTPSKIISWYDEDLKYKYEVVD